MTTITTGRVVSARRLDIFGYPRKHVPGQLARLYHVDRQRETTRHLPLEAFRPLEELYRALTATV
jgi:hypothetical protein